ncbi:MAG: hypothetical protein LBR89_02320 [Holosporales bacterium]|jgi:hypothetical protein|nr:hypothetical protein [Holosporales bacterium]
MILSKNIKWLVIGFIASWGTNLNASSKVMRKYANNLHDHEDIQQHPLPTIATGDEWHLRWESSYIYGNLAVGKLSPDEKASLDQWLYLDLSKDNVNGVAHSIFNALLRGQSWLGVDRYASETLVKIGKGVRDDKIYDLKESVKQCCLEWATGQLTYFENPIKQCIIAKQPLPHDLAIAIAKLLYQADYQSNLFKKWVRTVVASEPTITLDKETREMCDKCATQIFALMAPDLVAADPSWPPMFVPNVGHAAYLKQIDASDMHSARQHVWRAFVLEGCPQLSQLPDVSPIWPDGWWGTWNAAFYEALRSMMLRLAPSNVQEIIDRLKRISPDVLPTTCPPDLMELLTPIKIDEHQVRPAVYQAWMKAWEYTCEVCAQVTPE